MPKPVPNLKPGFEGVKKPELNPKILYKLPTLSRDFKQCLIVLIVLVVVNQNVYYLTLLALKHGLESFGRQTSKSRKT